MRTFPRRTCSGARGFTFIEVMVTLVVLTLLTVIAVPAFRTILEGERDRELRRFMAALRQMCTNAVLERSAYRMEIDLTRQEYRPLRRGEFGKYEPFSEDRPLAPHPLPEAVRLTEFVPYGAATAPLTSRVATVNIDPSGFIDPFLLHVREQDQDWTVRVGFTCKPELSAGHVDALLE